MMKSRNNLPTIDNLTGADREIVETGLRRGATRREVMSWIIASGATIAAAGSIVFICKNSFGSNAEKGWENQVCS